MLDSTLRRPASTPERLVVDVYLPSCCGQREALDEESIHTVPPQVAMRGVDQETWQKWMSEFQCIVRDDSLPVMGVLVSVLSGIGIPYALYKLNRLQRALARFQDEFNKNVMEPRGMYMKTASSTFDAAREHGHLHLQADWFAIAFTPSEIRSLKAEEYHYWYGPCSGAHYAGPTCTRCVEVGLLCGAKLVM
ncbi:hypothetical protein M427DRAFT_392258 [Gonapodya prolifera JEL478]|uniref:Uncharacterized protein n=1 Tax=Gonapodya prolifera (strain JEL478) TaxID=1344416 RepID=A0A139A0I9_GONPJ|nr:hypothetical protein M427DRAFT_183227 [Gonapodya prolifera JEL478]KXS12577.1 hypothetical protein M427DRAFT_392258 [Gonapodya prolifera JEL478]|eukprot:KXS10252.1 hypothetical protein M427DRAFT_183227 [Gonapodya prolifera JEL478]